MKRKYSDIIQAKINYLFHNVLNVGLIFLEIYLDIVYVFDPTYLQIQ